MSLASVLHPRRQLSGVVMMPVSGSLIISARNANLKNWDKFHFWDIEKTLSLLSGSAVNQVMVPCVRNGTHFVTPNGMTYPWRKGMLTPECQCLTRSGCCWAAAHRSLFTIDHQAHWQVVPVHRWPGRLLIDNHRHRRANPGPWRTKM